MKVRVVRSQTLCQPPCWLRLLGVSFQHVDVFAVEYHFAALIMDGRNGFDPAFGRLGDKVQPAARFRASVTRLTPEIDC